MAILSKPFRTVPGRDNSSGRFYLGDCLELFEEIPRGSVDVIVTSPPYNLGIRYSTYQDTLTQDDYLAWTSEWVAAASRVLTPRGSMFLNVGTRPSDPWTALDVAQAARRHLRLQNVIHWIKSIAIEKGAAGAAAALSRDLAVGHYKPINSDRYLNDCHEFIFHLTPNGDTPLDRLALGVPYQDQSNIARWRAAADGVRCRGNDSAPRSRSPAPRDFSRPPSGTVPPPARSVTDCRRDGSVRRAREHGGRVRAAWIELSRIGCRRDVPGGGGRADESGRKRPLSPRARKREDEEGYGFAGV